MPWPQAFAFHTYFKFYKSVIVFFADLFSTFMAVLLVVWINSERSVALFADQTEFVSKISIILGVQALTNLGFGLYRGAWRFASIPDLLRIIKACLLGTLILVSLNAFLTHSSFPRSTFPLFCFFSIFLISAPRLAYRWMKDSHKLFKDGKKVLIIGAGSAGETIIRELKRESSHDLIPVALVDDDPSKLGIEIHGIRVLGSSTQLKKVVAKKNIDLILIAIPEANSAEMRRIVNLCEETGVSYRTLPRLNDIAKGRTHITNIRNVTVEDLLGRDAVQFDHDKICQVLNNKKILVTGAGGSIGSELCRKIAVGRPQALILVEANEFNLFKIYNELKTNYPDLLLHYYLINVTNEIMINEIMENHKPNFVFHAAAYKHVPLLESHPKIAIENNIFGTQVVAQAAKNHHTEVFILVSTDKAVNSANVMGATKRCAEILCQCLNQSGKTCFVTVRFGNVLGSTGSVIPIFEEQIQKGGPVTVTHPEMERFFMTIPEAAQLIIQILTLEDKNDFYILDMGEPVKILYLAEQMIKLAGHIPYKDIPITFSGLRPGEKMYEELFYNHEDVQRLNQSKILRLTAQPIHYRNFLLRLNELKNACERNDSSLKSQLFRLANLENIDDIESRAKFSHRENYTTIPV